MGQANKTAPKGNRLSTIYETRQKGWTKDPRTLLPVPAMVTYHIGHGQQLARARHFK